MHPARLGGHGGPTQRPAPQPVPPPAPVPLARTKPRISAPSRPARRRCKPRKLMKVILRAVFPKQKPTPHHRADRHGRDQGENGGQGEGRRHGKSGGTGDGTGQPTGFGRCRKIELSITPMPKQPSSLQTAEPRSPIAKTLLPNA